MPSPESRTVVVVHDAGRDRLPACVLAQLDHLQTEGELADALKVALLGDARRARRTGSNDLDLGICGGPQQRMPACAFGLVLAGMMHPRNVGPAFLLDA